MIDRKVSLWLGPAFVIAALTLAAPATSSAEPVRLEPGVHQLFLDDAMVAERSNVTSTMHPSQEFAGNPVLMPALGVETLALLYGSVLYDDEASLFKMWSCAPGRDIHPVWRPGRVGPFQQLDFVSAGARRR